jgi:hypothetical protein
MSKISLLFIALVLVAGCSQPAPTGVVSGTATFQGTPIANGLVTLQSSAGTYSVAVPITDGKFRAEKVPLGNAKFTVQGVKASPTGGTGESYIPENAPGQKQEVTIREGEQTLDLHIGKK